MTTTATEAPDPEIPESAAAYALALLEAAGHVTQEKVDEALAIAAQYFPPSQAAHPALQDRLVAAIVKHCTPSEISLGMARAWAFTAIKEAMDGCPQAHAAAPAAGWTGNADADLALILLDRLDCSGDDAARVDQLEGLVRKLATPAQAAQPVDLVALGLGGQVGRPFDPAQSPDLVSAARAVLARWDSPQWEWIKHGPTADLMADLRRAIDSSPAPAAAPDPPGFPELPKPGIYTTDHLGQVTTYLGYSAEQMIAYGEDCRATPAQGSKPDQETPAQAAQPVACMHADGRVVPASTMEAAKRDGGVMLSSLSGYPTPLYTAPQAAQAPDHLPEAGKMVPLTNARISKAAQRLAAEFDYPWIHMPEKGRDNMRRIVREVLSSLGIPAPGVGDANG